MSVDAAGPSAASVLLATSESLVDDWLSIEREEAEGRGARRDELQVLLNDLVDELVAAAVMEAKQRAPLSRHDRNEADSLLSRTPPGSLVASAFNIDIRGRELSCLRRRQWLNDEVINMYLQLIEQRQDRQQSHNTQHTLHAAHYTVRRPINPHCRAIAAIEEQTGWLTVLVCVLLCVTRCCWAGQCEWRRVVPSLLLLQHVTAMTHSSHSLAVTAGTQLAIWLVPHTDMLSAVCAVVAGLAGLRGADSSMLSCWTKGRTSTRTWQGGRGKSDGAPAASERSP